VILFGTDHHFSCILRKKDSSSACTVGENHA
jgi:hypothetical protein